MYPGVVQAFSLEHGFIYVYFEDGAIRHFDVRPLLEKGKVFEPLRDEEIFRKCLTVLNDTAAWDLTGQRDPYDCIDLDPEVLYAAPAVSDPLENAV